MTIAYAGGYYMNREPIVRGFGPNSHTAKDLSKISKYAVRALNLMQETPWAVNSFILSVINSMVGEGKNVGFEEDGKFETVVIIEKPQDPRKDPLNPVNLRLSPERWEQLSKEQKSKVKAVAAKEYQNHEETLGSYMATRRLINTANEMSEHAFFYFPHNMDFRTRAYPIPTDLTPQASDLSKGLLKFSRGTRLGTEGVYWLGVMTATHYGEDKLTMDDRYAFAVRQEFLDECAAWVDDPMVNRGWLKADKPFQFLAVAFEWVWANRMEDPEAFISYLPGNLDGSCNGAQHLSILSRDSVGAKATNCTSDPNRNDLYQQVGDELFRLVQIDEAKGVKEAIFWAKKLARPKDRRKVVKRSVMTVPYGVTGYGIATFMLKEHLDKDEWPEAKYIRDLLIACIDATLDKGRALQRYFSQCAARCADAGLPLCWDTPAGSKVTMAYRNVIQKRVTGFCTKFVVYEEPEEDEDGEEFLKRIGMDMEAMVRGAPPNVVHSCDASHMQITVCRMADAGIKDFSMIHDSFGCPMAHVGLMRDILRHAIVDMYSGDFLQRWRESVEHYSGLEMPDPEFVMGDFDINEILQSEFFFS